MATKEDFLKCISVKDSGCWEWYKFIPAGYGYVYHNKRTYLAHRFSAYLFMGFDLSSDLLILHKCDNKRCVNPAHLLTGTQKDNMIDAGRKGLIKHKPRSACRRGHSNTPENLIQDGKYFRCKICRNYTAMLRRQK